MIVLDGKQVEVPNVRTLSYLDDAKFRLKMGEDGRARKTRWIRGIVLHTTKGWPDVDNETPQKILPGSGKPGRAEAVCEFWSTSEKSAGAHLVVDFDGTVVCTADLMREVAFHAGVVNEVSVGIEIYQGGKSEMYEAQMVAVVNLLNYLTKRLGIQRQIPHKYDGVVPRLAGGGTDLIGVYGHRDVTSNRGFGDPGDAVFDCLASEGYERFDFKAGQDVTEWKTRQFEMGVGVDGVPGPNTYAAIRAKNGSGMWVTLPGD